MSVVPKPCSHIAKPFGLQIFAANVIKIKTYGKIRRDLDFEGLSNKITWNFLIADVPYPILGANALAELKRQCLIDAKTQQRAYGTVKNTPGRELSLVDPKLKYAHILSQFPRVVGLLKSPVTKQCDTVHFMFI